MSAGVKMNPHEPDVGDATPTSATSESDAPTLPDDYLTNALWALLAHSNANGGRMDPALFWGFVGRLAQGRGLDATGHAEGLEAIEAECINPNRKGDEARRVYNLAVLRWLLWGLHESGADGTLAPLVNVPVMVADLGNMIDAEGDAPQLLRGRRSPKARPDERKLRAHYRVAYVLRLHHDAVREGKRPAKMRARDGVRADKWARWCDEAGTARIAEAVAGAGAGAPAPFADNDRWELLLAAGGVPKN